MVKIDHLQHQRKGILYYFLSTLMLALMLFSYIFGTTIIDMMDVTGWTFFTLSCLSHAAILLLPALLGYALLARLRYPRLATTWFVAIVALLMVVLMLNRQVYQLYRFHINGIILNMFFGSGAREIFNFDGTMLLKEGGILLLFVAAAVALWRLVPTLMRRVNRRQLWAGAGLLLLATLVANALYVYGSFFQQPAVTKSKTLIPYYFPLSATRALENMGFKQPVTPTADARSASDFCYPLHPLKVQNAQRPNIVFLFIDSWNKRTLTPETMPHVYRFATESQWYDNHFSCSNGTRTSIFGLFFSVPGHYWESFVPSHVSPVFIDELLAEGYQLRIHGSATLIDPPFANAIFQRVPHLQISTPGATTYDRDRRITTDFIRELPTLKRQAPFFAFLFYDLAHSFEYPKKLPKKFTPSWDYADYTRLNNDTDPTPFFNLYRNCCWQIDRMIGEVIAQLKQEGLYDNTIIVVSGDHAQEFNENKKNFWGHNGNFSPWQIGVPLLYKAPNTKPQKFHYRTTHYDIIPTLMHNALGVTNPIGDYSVGHLLTDRQPRRWHMVGSDLNYGFIIGGDTIITKQPDGTMDVTDSHLNPIPNFHINPRQFNDAIQRANRFFKK